MENLPEAAIVLNCADVDETLVKDILEDADEGRYADDQIAENAVVQITENAAVQIGQEVHIAGVENEENDNHDDPDYYDSDFEFDFDLQSNDEVITNGESRVDAQGIDLSIYFVDRPQIILVELSPNGWQPTLPRTGGNDNECNC